MLFNGFDLLIMSKITTTTTKTSLCGFVLDFLIKHVMVAITVIIFLASNPGKQGKEASCYQRKTKTKKSLKKKVVSNWYSLVDIPNYAAGVEDGAWDVFLFV